MAALTKRDNQIIAKVHVRTHKCRPTRQPDEELAQNRVPKNILLNLIGVEKSFQNELAPLDPRHVL